jgi:ABC-type Zn uptake system ZnuABC Zn-binding protein ZnuA
MKTSLSFVIAVIAVAAGACGSEEGGSAPGPTVVATTTQAADLARSVARGRADVVGMLATNSDPHEFEPRPSDAEALLDAGLFVRSGGDVDLWLDDLLESSGADADTLSLIDHVNTLAGEHQHAEGEDEAHAEEEVDGDEIDPHWWQDPANAVLAVEAIRAELAEADPDGADIYQRNAAAEIRELERLDRAVARCVESIPAERRKLVTTHDSLEYFAHRYGLEVVGAAIPALTTQAQPSAGETAELIDLIRAEDVGAVFPETGVSAEVESAIAAETDAQLGGELYADTLGPEGSGAETYAGAVAANARTIATALSGDSAACEIQA